MPNGQDSARFIFELVEPSQPTEGGIAPSATPRPAGTPPKNEATRQRQEADAAAGGSAAKAKAKQEGVQASKASNTALKDFATEAAASKLGRFRAPLEAAVRQFGGGAEAAQAAAAGGKAAKAAKAGSAATTAARSGQAVAAGGGGALAVAGPALAAGGVALAIVAAQVKGAQAVSAAQRAAIGRTADLSPDVALAQAQSEILRLRANLRTAERFGPRLAEAELASTQLKVAKQQLADAAAGSRIGEDISSLKELAAAGIDKITEVVETVDKFAPPGLATMVRDILDAAGILPDKFAALRDQSIFADFEHLPFTFPEELRGPLGGAPDPVATDIPFAPALP